METKSIAKYLQHNETYITSNATVACTSFGKEHEGTAIQSDKAFDVSALQSSLDTLEKDLIHMPVTRELVRGFSYSTGKILKGSDLFSCRAYSPLPVPDLHGDVRMQQSYVKKPVRPPRHDIAQQKSEAIIPIVQSSSPKIPTSQSCRKHYYQDQDESTQQEETTRERSSSYCDTSEYNQKTSHNKRACRIFSACVVQETEGYSNEHLQVFRRNTERCNTFSSSASQEVKGREEQKLNSTPGKMLCKYNLSTNSGVDSIDNASDAFDGEYLEYKYIHENTVYATEKAERIDVASFEHKALSLRKAYLLKLLEHADDIKQRMQIAQEIYLCTHMLSCIHYLKTNWVGSDTFRKQLRHANPVKLQKTFSHAFSAGCLNLRYQSCSVGARSISFFRLGAMTDYANGFVSLVQLEKYAQDPEKKRIKIEKLRKKKEEFSANLEKNYAKIVAIDHALREIDQCPQTIAKRICSQAHQMLHLVCCQLDKHFDAIDMEQKSFSFAHIGLLNPIKKEKVDSSGSSYSEQHAIEDMQYIFSYFKNKIVIFDGLGPFLDEHFTIHMPTYKEDEQGKPLEIALNPLFFNVSVQGCKTNEEPQKTINEQSLITLQILLGRKSVNVKRAVERRLNQVRVALGSNQSNYALAETLARCVLEVCPLSIGCRSAKDRTGFLGARIVFQSIIEEINRMPLPDSLKDALRLKFGSEILSKEGIAASIVKDCTGIEVLKLTEFDLKEFSEGIEGLARRIMYYLDLIKDVYGPNGTHTQQKLELDIRKKVFIQSSDSNR